MHAENAWRNASTEPTRQWTDSSELLSAPLMQIVGPFLHSSTGGFWIQNGLFNLSPTRDTLFSQTVVRTAGSRCQEGILYNRANGHTWAKTSYPEVMEEKEIIKGGTGLPLPGRTSIKLDTWYQPPFSGPQMMPPESTDLGYALPLVPEFFSAPKEECSVLIST